MDISWLYLEVCGSVVGVEVSRVQGISSELPEQCVCGGGDLWVFIRFPCEHNYAFFIIIDDF